MPSAMQLLWRLLSALYSDVHYSCRMLAGTLMFTALGSFFNRISDPEMGKLSLNQHFICALPV